MNEKPVKRLGVVCAVMAGAVLLAGGLTFGGYERLAVLAEEVDEHRALLEKVAPERSAVERALYNEAVRDFNRARNGLPAVLYVRLFGERFAPRPYVRAVDDPVERPPDS